MAALLRRLAGSDPVETHISAVYIGRLTAWKLKKAVRLSFLDFTRIEDRHRLLVRELELNKPAAPEIYRDVAAIVRTRHGALTITTEPGDQPPLDWVLRMAPVAPEAFLDRVAAAGQLTLGLLDGLGDMVAAYHARLGPVEGWDSAEQIERAAEGNARSAEEAGLSPQMAADWLSRMRKAIAAQRGWLSGRARSGMVRRCHGDLHLANLLVWRGAPVPFDALEFDEALATIDVAYDLAFLLMDLDVCLGRAAANRVLNRYVARTGDVGLVVGLPPLLSMRAMVLAHVRARRGHAEESQRYLEAARSYLEPAAASVTAIGGLQGTGKSTLARRLAPALGRAPGALVLRSDEIRKRLHGLAPEAHAPEQAYTEAANAAVMATLIEGVGVAASGGHAVIADATFLDPADRETLAAAAKAAAVPLRGIWLEAPLPVLEARLAARRGDASDATAAVLRRAAERDPGPIDWERVDATDIERAAIAILGER